jgi:hypothetical protein
LEAKVVHDHGEYRLSNRPRRRQLSWIRRQSEGFDPIRQVGVATSIGFPLIIVGVLMLAIASSSGGTVEWASAIALLVGGVLLANSGRVT